MNWLSLALEGTDDSDGIALKEGENGMMLFGGIRETHGILLTQIQELHEVKNALRQIITAKWRAGGTALVAKKPEVLTDVGNLVRTEHLRLVPALPLAPTSWGKCGTWETYGSRRPNGGASSCKSGTLTRKTPWPLDRKPSTAGEVTASSQPS